MWRPTSASRRKPRRAQVRAVDVDVDALVVDERHRVARLPNACAKRPDHPSGRAMTGTAPNRAGREQWRTHHRPPDRVMRGAPGAVMVQQG